MFILLIFGVKVVVLVEDEVKDIFVIKYYFVLQCIIYMIIVFVLYCILFDVLELGDVEFFWFVILVGEVVD